MPWLLVGMVGSALATAMMVRFESALSANITVAFFIPAIIYLADAVGTQSEAVAVRGLSLTGADLAPLLMGELGTGVVIGTTLGCLAFPLVWLAFGSIGLATTVAIALVVASSIATTIGLVLTVALRTFRPRPSARFRPGGDRDPRCRVTAGLFSDRSRNLNLNRRKTAGTARSQLVGRRQPQG